MNGYSQSYFMNCVASRSVLYAAPPDARAGGARWGGPGGRQPPPRRGRARRCSKTLEAARNCCKLLAA
eukprot:15471627-Alexandrium_andersonii.AAC.1